MHKTTHHNPTHPWPIKLKADTGTLKHYNKPDKKHILACNNYIKNRPSVGLPDGLTMKTIMAKTGNVLKDLTN